MLVYGEQTSLEEHPIKNIQGFLRGLERKKITQQTPSRAPN